MDGGLRANLALDKPATQSSTCDWSRSRIPEEDARGANNGVTPDDFGFHTGRELNPWWQVDLQGEYVVREVMIFNRTHMAQRLRHFSILASLDGSTWATVFSKRDPLIFGQTGEKPYVVKIPDGRLGRFIRLRLDGHDCLHAREIQVFGELPRPDSIKDLRERENRMLDAERASEARQLDRLGQLTAGRTGRWVEIDGLEVFVDAVNHGPEVLAAIESGKYEGSERWRVKEIVSSDDRVIEAGTAIGVVAMTAALIVGAESVLTFDGNPEVVADARINFERNGLPEIRSRVGILRARSAMRADERDVPFYVAKPFWGSRLNASVSESNVIRVDSVPVYCLEDEIRAHGATALICDIEGGEAELLSQADLRGIRKIVIETHYWAAGKAAVDAMMRKLIMDGFSLDLDLSAHHFSVLTR